MLNEMYGTIFFFYMFFILKKAKYTSVVRRMLQHCLALLYCSVDYQTLSEFWGRVENDS